MKKVLLIAAAVSSLALVGCASQNVSQPSSPIVSKVEAPLKADVSVGEKITGTAKSTEIMGFIKLGPNKFADGVAYNEGGAGGNFLSMLSSSEGVKAAAAYDATSKSAADVIVAPRYTVETQDYFIFKTTTATVNGYKGTINGISAK